MKEGKLSDVKVLIAIPCTSMVSTDFLDSIMKLNNNGNALLAIENNSLVYSARNHLTMKALDAKADYIFWIDSDMVFDKDTLNNLLIDALENDLEFVTGLCFKRMLPTSPTIGKTLVWEQKPDGSIDSGAEVYEDYPKDQLFEIACSGLACALVKVSAIMEVAGLRKMSPFQPLPGLSEDYSFCFGMKALGKKMWCDSRVKIGHVGRTIFTEDVWLRQKEMEKSDV